MRLPFFGPKKSSGPLRLPLPASTTVAYAVYFRSQRPDPPTVAQLLPVVTAWLERHAQNPLRQAIREFIDRGLLQIQVGGRDLIPAPPPELLRVWQPGELEERRYAQATHMITIIGQDLLGPPRFGFWAAAAAARALAEASGGVILDPDFPRLLKLDTLTEDLPADGRIQVTDHIMVPRSVDQRGLMWMTTKGVAKFGLPELEIRDAPPNLAEALGYVINATAQHLAQQLWRLHAEREEPPKELPVGPEIRISLEDVSAAYGGDDFTGPPEGTQGWAMLRLEHHPGRGRSDDFVRLVAPLGVREKHSVWLNGVLADLLGLGESTLRNVKTDSEAMEAAHLQAVSELPVIKQRFQGGLLPGETLIVKYGFPTQAEHNEYMWLAVNTWRGDRLQTQLMNNPQIRKDLRAGQPVEIREADIFDWALMLPNDEMEGGYTNRVVMRDGEPG